MSLSKVREAYPDEVTPTHYELRGWRGPNSNREFALLGSADNLDDIRRLREEDSLPGDTARRGGEAFTYVVYPDGSRVHLNLYHGPRSVVGTKIFHPAHHPIRPLEDLRFDLPPHPEDGIRDTLTGDSEYYNEYDTGRALRSRHSELIWTLAHAAALKHPGFEPFLAAALRDHDLTPLHAAADWLDEQGHEEKAKRLRLLLGQQPSGQVEKFARDYALAIKKR